MSPLQARVSNPLRPRAQWQDAVILAVLLALAASLAWPMLNCYFDKDDLNNLSDYVEAPGTALVSNLLLFTDFKRPGGALVYLPLYWAFEMNPFPYYLTGMVIYLVNLILIYRFALRLTGSRATAVIAVGLCAFHRILASLLVNFGTLYDMISLTAILCALLAYQKYALSDFVRRRWYAATLVCFWLALNLKELAVSLPVILLLFEAFYVPRSSAEVQPRLAASWRLRRGFSLRLAPFFAISAAYGLVKYFGGATINRNPLYAFHFDATIINNIATHLTHYAFNEVAFGPWSALLALAAALAAALVLGNRHMIFGLCFGLLTLGAVLPLPRTWEIFLYVPIVGFSLCVAAFLADIGTRIGKLLPKVAPPPALRATIGVAAAVIFFSSLLAYSRPTTHRFIEKKAARGQIHRSFAQQLYTRFPDIRVPTVLGIENPPVPTEGMESYTLHFIVWLHYGRNIVVIRLPQRQEEFLRFAHQGVRSRYLVWTDEGQLVERDWHQLLPPDEGQAAISR